MKLSRYDRLYVSRLMVCLFFTLFLTLPTTVLATPYLYTYTGNAFVLPIVGSVWDTSDYLTISLVLDPALGPGTINSIGTTPIPFTMSAGGLSMTSSDPTASYIMEMLSWNSQGQITEWNIRETVILSPGILLSFASNNICWDDHVSIFDETTRTTIAQVITPGVGEWTSQPLPDTAPVPEPATLILLGSGLLGLAANIIRKRNY